jgi:uncharacterized membrane protein (DUF373 family)
MENILKFGILDNSILFSLFVLELILSLGLLLNLIKILYDIYSFYPNINEIIKHLVNDALSMFILIEIIKSINDYIYYKRIRISVVLDVSIIILLRELVLGLYQHTISAKLCYHDNRNNFYNDNCKSDNNKIFSK